MLMPALHYLIDRQGGSGEQHFVVNAIAAYGGARLAASVLAPWSRMIYEKLLTAILATGMGEDFASFTYALSFTLIFAALISWLNKQGKRISM